MTTCPILQSSSILWVTNRVIQFVICKNFDSTLQNTWQVIDVELLAGIQMLSSRKLREWSIFVPSEVHWLRLRLIAIC